jgi:hypothetical protein
MPSPIVVLYAPLFGLEMSSPIVSLFFVYNNQEVILKYLYFFLNFGPLYRTNDLGISSLSLGSIS